MRFATFNCSGRFGSSFSTVHRAAMFQVAVILFCSCGLEAQEGEVIGDRAELQKVLDAYDQLRATLESYDATVECKSVNVANGQTLEVQGEYEISKRGSLYNLSKVIDIIDFDKNGRHFESQDYLDTSIGYSENVESRVGIIMTSQKEKVDADVYTWTPLVLPLTSPIDLDCFCIRHGRPFRPMMDPENMRGIPRQIHVETAANGNVILTRKYPSGTVLEMIASAENGYLLTSYRFVVHTKPEQGVEQADFTWSKRSDGSFMPKSKSYRQKLKENSESRTWLVTSLTTPSAKTEIKKFSLNPPVGWKIVDVQTKAEKVIGGEEGKRVRALLDSTNRVQIVLPNAPY